MLSLLSDIRHAWEAFLSIWVWLALGGAIGIVAVVQRPLGGLLGGAIVGAGIMGFALMYGFFTDHSAEIDRLRAENRRLELKQEELRATGLALRETLAELAEQNAANERTMEDLRGKLDDWKEDPNCTIPGDIIDDLRKIR